PAVRRRRLRPHRLQPPLQPPARPDRSPERVLAGPEERRTPGPADAPPVLLRGELRAGRDEQRPGVAVLLPPRSRPEVRGGRPRITLDEHVVAAAAQVQRWNAPRPRIRHRRPARAAPEPAAAARRPVVAQGLPDGAVHASDRGTPLNRPPRRAVA